MPLQDEYDVAGTPLTDKELEAYRRELTPLSVDELMDRYDNLSAHYHINGINGVVPIFVRQKLQLIREVLQGRVANAG